MPQVENTADLVDKKTRAVLPDCVRNADPNYRAAAAQRAIGRGATLQNSRSWSPPTTR